MSRAFGSVVKRRGVLVAALCVTASIALYALVGRRQDQPRETPTMVADRSESPADAATEASSAPPAIVDAGDGEAPFASTWCPSVAEHNRKVIEQVADYSPGWGGWRGQDDEILAALFPLTTEAASSE